MFSCRIPLRPRGRHLSARWEASHSFRCSRGLERFYSMVSQIPPQAENGEAYTVDGRKRLAGLMKHNIGLHRELKTVKKMRWKDMSVEIAGRHTLQWPDIPYFTTQGLSYVEVVCRRYVADNVKPLWWRTQAIGQFPPVVRNKATARMNAAFKQALQDAGYDMQGRRVPNRQSRPGSGDKTITHLSGTVVFKSHVPTAVHKVPFKDLQSYCEGVVKAVEQTLGHGPGGPVREVQAGPRQHDLGRSSGGSNRGGGGNRGGSGSRGGRGGQANKAGQRSRW